LVLATMESVFLKDIGRATTASWHTITAGIVTTTGTIITSTN
jgi:hypothetical protein